jgi:anti-sigma regulatory factor (Ser/Thr protein kinase)
MSFRLPAATHSAPRARERLRTVMGAWADEATRDEAELLLTELVANGVLHAHSPMEIHLTVEHNLLRAEVRDASPEAPRQREVDENGGRGFLILDALASSWGVLGHPGTGKTVWFELTDSAPAGHLGAASLLEPGPRFLESN